MRVRMKPPKPPEEGDRRTKGRFLWLPANNPMDPEDWRWLERVTERQEWQVRYSGRGRYVSGWVPVAWLTDAHGGYEGPTTRKPPTDAQKPRIEGRVRKGGVNEPPTSKRPRGGVAGQEIKVGVRR